MAIAGRKKKQYSSEELKILGLVDIIGKGISKNDKVVVCCNQCNKIEFDILMSRVLEKHESNGNGWRCRDCYRISRSEDMSKKTGNKALFFGKKHTEESNRKRKEGYQKYLDNKKKSK